MANKKIQFRFLKINKDAYIYEEFDGKQVKEICIELHMEKVKRKKEYTLTMIASNSIGSRKKYGDKTHAVTIEEFISFFERTNDCIADLRFYTYPKPFLSIKRKLINPKLLIYTI